MIEYNNEKPAEPEFLQKTGNWYRQQYSLSLGKRIIVVDGVLVKTDRDITLISYWNSSNSYTTERHSLPNTWEWT